MVEKLPATSFREPYQKHKRNVSAFSTISDISIVGGPDLFINQVYSICFYQTKVPKGPFYFFLREKKILKMFKIFRIVKVF